MEITPSVHDIDLGIVHAYLYDDAGRLTLIDTGLATSARAIVTAIEGIGRKISDLHQIVVTHYHADHTGALAELAERSGAQVLVYALDAPVVRGDVEEPPPVLSDLERPYFERAKNSTPPAPPCRVDRELVDGDELDIGRGAKTVHVPGHTAGSIAVYLPAERSLFVGDAAARLPDGSLVVGVFNVDSALARQSFSRLAALDIEAIFFGHGPSMDKDASTAFRHVAERLAR